jgi:hypothetical protein
MTTMLPIDAIVAVAGDAAGDDQGQGRPLGALQVWQGLDHARARAQGKDGTAGVVNPEQVTPCKRQKIHVPIAALGHF